jgi:hypothetical protein
LDTQSELDTDYNKLTGAFWKQMSTQPSVSWRGTGDIHAIAKEGEKKTKQNTPTGVNSKDIVYWI